MPWADLNAEGALALTRQPAVGDTFQVVFTFTVTDSLLHSRQEPDSAWIVCREGLVRFVDGDTVLRANFETGKQYELRARFRILSGPRLWMLGGVLVRQALGKVAPSLNPNEGPLGIPARKTFGITSIDLPTEEQKAEAMKQPISQLLVTDSGAVSLGTTMERAPIMSRHAVKSDDRTAFDISAGDTLLFFGTEQDSNRVAFRPENSSDTVQITRISGDASFVRTGPRAGWIENPTGDRITLFRVSDGQATAVLKVEWAQSVH